MSTTSQISSLATRIGQEAKALWAAVNAKAPLSSPALTGTPTAPTAAGGTSTTQLATTEFVRKTSLLTSISDATDWNTITNPGIHPVLLLGSSTNGPGVGEYFYVNVMQYSSSSQVLQVAYPYQDGGLIWIRTSYGGTWGTWRMIPRVVVSSTAPGSPSNGDLWVDTSTPTWSTLSMINNWQPWSGTPGAQYMKDAMGFVHLRGLIQYGNANAIATLPTGYRPISYGQIFTSHAGGGQTRLDVGTSGVIQVNGYYANGNNSYVSLDGITFATF